jgi:hypothetical protein
VIFSESAELTGGTKETAEFAEAIGKPLLHLLSSAEINESATQLNSFLKEHGIVVLNVAGPRALEEPEVSKFVKAVLSHALISLVR